MSDEEFSIWQKEEDRIRLEYDRAYDRTISCSESELEEAEKTLAFWRHKYFSH
jgi:hypothetical protein